MPTTNVLPTMLALDAATLTSLMRLAARRESTVHGLLLEAVQQYLDSAATRDESMRESFDAWADFPQQSEQMSTEQRDAWIAMLEAGAASAVAEADAATHC